MSQEDLVARAAKVKLLALDVDGVLTNGDITYGANGEEIKTFNVKDGFGLVQVERHGIVTVIITGRNSPVVAHRAKELKISHTYQDVPDKLVVLKLLCEQLSISLDEVAYVGDDIPDLCVLENVGLACCPCDAVDSVLKACHLITRLAGGRGAVREITDFILSAQRL